MEIIHAVILGIVEGLTEFLPVSSTGHLIIASEVLGLEQTDFLKTFEIVIQTGAILAVLPAFIQTFFKERTLWWYAIVAFIPTAFFGFVFHDVVKSVMEAGWIVGVTLIVGGVIMIGAEYVYARTSTLKQNRMTLISAFYIGTCQACAIIPGVSRSGATVVGGLLRNFDRTLLVRFSFLLSVPTIAAAGAFDLLKTQQSFTPYEWVLLTVGFVTSWLAAAFCVRWFIRFISSHSFAIFGWYRIVAGILFLSIFFW